LNMIHAFTEHNGNDSEISSTNQTAGKGYLLSELPTTINRIPEESANVAKLTGKKRYVSKVSTFG